jgi:hypothetical protein
MHRFYKILNYYKLIKMNMDSLINVIMTSNDDHCHP